jgi:hypothetical protein
MTRIGLTLAQSMRDRAQTGLSDCIDADARGSRQLMLSQLRDSAVDVERPRPPLRPHERRQYKRVATRAQGCSRQPRREQLVVLYSSKLVAHRQLRV